WGVVLRAAGGERLEPRALHAANAGAFLAGTVQGQSAMPTRVALLRRFGGTASPTIARGALGGAPIGLFEICGGGIWAGRASPAVGVVRVGARWAVPGPSLVVLTGLRRLYRRFRDR